jgi:hypothetical protein
MRVEAENQRLIEENARLAQVSEELSQTLRDVRHDCAGLRADNSELRRSLEAQSRRNKELSELARVEERVSQVSEYHVCRLRGWGWYKDRW